MNIPILIEPTANGFRATVGGPFNYAEEAATEQEALAAVQVRVAERCHGGARLLSLGFDLASERTAPPAQPGPSLAENPLFGDFMRVLQENRDREYAEVCAAVDDTEAAATSS